MSYSSEVLADSPVAYYRCDESSGQLQDSSGNANHTTSVTGTPAYSQSGALAADPSSTSVFFEFSTGDHFSAPHHSALNVGDVFSLEAWVKKDGDGLLGVIMGKNTNTWDLLLMSDNTFALDKSGVAIIVQSTVTVTADGNFHHLVATKNGSTVKLYKDSVDVTGTVTNQTCTTNSSTLDIGHIGGAFHNDAWFDELAIYPTALSSARVLAHYEAATAADTQSFYASRRRAWR